MNEWVASCGLGTEARCLDVAGAELFFGGMEYGTFTFLQGGPCAAGINAIGGLDESDGDFCANDEGPVKCSGSCCGGGGRSRLVDAELRAYKGLGTS